MEFGAISPQPVFFSAANLAHLLFAHKEPGIPIWGTHMSARPKASQVTLARRALKWLHGAGSRHWCGLALSAILLDPVSLAQTRAEAIVPPLDRISDSALWRVVNRRASLHEEGGRSFVRLDHGTGIGGAWLAGSDFKEGAIEVELRGKDIPGQSFVGIAFRGVDDNTRDVVYFRPFNFQDPERRTHSVQYESRPNFPWDKLRADTPSKYEAAIDPAPGAEDWFHVRIVVENRTVSVYINGAVKPALVVTELSGRSGGLIGLDGANADYANLKIRPKEQ